VADLAAAGKRLDLVGHVRLEVAGVLVHVDPGAHAGRVELGVELGGVDVRADPERLHRAGLRAREQYGMAGQLADRLLVAGERVERRGEPAQQRIVAALRGERDPDGSDRLGMAAVEHRALVAAERPDAVAGPEEREVRAGHRVQQAAQVRLDPPLHRGLGLLRVGVVERPAAEHDPGPVREVDVAERAAIEPQPLQLALAEPGQVEERLILVVRRGVVGADGQQQEGSHPITLVGCGRRLSWALITSWWSVPASSPPSP
jgi:hypothetical protein